MSFDSAGSSTTKSAFALLLIIFTLLLVDCTSHPMKISCRVLVQMQFQTDQPGWKPPNGESESTRYTKSYEAYWWNCVMVRAKDLDARCPFICSGTPAATYGCRDGEMDANRQIDQLLKRYSSREVGGYLRSLARRPEAKEKIAPYFPDGPQGFVERP